MSSYHYSFYSPHGLHCLLSVFSHRFQIYTELLAEYILPQISQIYTEVRLPSRGCTCLKCTNRARSAPTKQNRYSPTESTEPTELLAECILPQISQIYTEVRLPSRGCTCLKCTNQARSSPPEISRFCEFCVFCGRHFATAEARIPPLLSTHPNHLCRSAFYVNIQMF